MIKIIKNYLRQNLFYVSVIITGIVSFLMGLFYVLLKNELFEMTSSNYLEGTGVLANYVTVSTDRPSGVYYFLIGLFCAFFFFLIVSLILKGYLKKDYFQIFNLFGILNVILMICLILGVCFINISVLFTYIILFVFLLFYLFGFYKSLDLLNIDKKKKIFSLLIFVLPIIIILLILKLFV